MIITIPPTLANQVCTVKETEDNTDCNKTPTKEKITENPNTKKTLLTKIFQSLFCFLYSTNLVS